MIAVGAIVEASSFIDPVPERLGAIAVLVVFFFLIALPLALVIATVKAVWLKVTGEGERRKAQQEARAADWKRRADKFYTTGVYEPPGAPKPPGVDNYTTDR